MTNAGATEARAAHGGGGAGGGGVGAGAAEGARARVGADHVQLLPDDLAALAGGTRIRLLLVRHAETEHNVHHRIQGWSDSPITELGRAQIADVAAMLAGERVDLAFSSDLPRTRTTAEGILGAMDAAPPFELREDLREWNFGGHEEQAAKDVWGRLIEANGIEVGREANVIAAVAEQLSWEGVFDGLADIDETGTSEGAAAIVVRADAALSAIIGALAALPVDDRERVGLVVSHGGFISTMLRQLAPDEAPEIILPNCSVTTVTLADGRWHLDALGVVAPRR